ncbi:MAG: hypothetical protein RR569_08610, partial [Acinetobacter sp.]
MNADISKKEISSLNISLVNFCNKNSFSQSKYLNLIIYCILFIIIRLNLANILKVPFQSLTFKQ